MPAFTAFPNQLYESGVEYISVSTLIETNANWAELEIVTPGAIIDELPTTEIYLAIEIADVLVSNPPTPDDGLPHDLDYTYYPGPYRLAFGASITGTDGREFSKPGNPLIKSAIQPYRGKYVRAKMTMTNATSSQLRIRVDGRTYN